MGGLNLFVKRCWCASQCPHRSYPAPPRPSRQVIRIVPRLNEDVNQEWISDKARFQYDALRYQRLNVPYVKGDKVRWLVETGRGVAMGWLGVGRAEIVPKECRC